MDLNDSPTESGDMYCAICTSRINGNIYTMIDNQNEKGKYHINCLEKWISRSKNGILTREEIESYSIYNNDIIIDTINFKKKNVSQNQIILMPYEKPLYDDNDPLYNINKILTCLCISIICFVMLVYLFYYNTQQ